MASRICNSLLSEAWRSCANDLDEAPHTDGIYAIGLKRAGDVRYIYVGHSRDIRRRLQQHKSQTLAIDEFVKEEFRSNGGHNLRIKWVEETNGRCVEGDYLTFILHQCDLDPDKGFFLFCGNCCPFLAFFWLQGGSLRSFWKCFFLRLP